MSGRNGTLSPVSVESSDWSPVSRYTNLNGSDNPYSPTVPNRPPLNTPPTSVHNSSSTTATATTDVSAMSRRTTASNGNPSPPSSIARSSDGTGLYAPSIADSVKRQAMEEALQEHHTVLKHYLRAYLHDDKGNPRPNRARDKLLRLSAVQFHELSTDVYDESLRREEDRRKPGSGTPKFLPPKTEFHPKRNQARQKLSTLPLERFRQLATDVFYELERRNPQFMGKDPVERVNSPAPSIALSTTSSHRAVPPRTGTPDGLGPPGFRGPAGRGAPPGPFPSGPPPRLSGPGGSARPPNEFGRPLPKTFQSNTIIPNKSTMVEDDDDQSGPEDDDDDQEEAFGLEGAAKTRQSRRTTGKSLGSLAGQADKAVADLQSQVSQLQGKVDDLESKLREKDAQVERLRSEDTDKEKTISAERSQWSELRTSLERKLEEALSLNESLRSELDKVRSENAATEKELRADIEEAKRSGGSGEEWRARYENLEKELSEQQQVTEDVRREASQFLQEMRALSERSSQALEKEERLEQQVALLENELRDWKSRYARAKTQVRTLRASSMGLGIHNPDASHYTRDSNFTSSDGLVQDVHVTKFQLSIDELLQTARKAEPQAVLDGMKNVVMCVRQITQDIDASSAAPSRSSLEADVPDSPSTPKMQHKLKSRVSATANNLITASKNHAAAGGLSPVSLLDAAASHLTTAIVELVRAVKIRPTPTGELEAGDDDKPTPLRSYLGLHNGYGHSRARSGGSMDSTGFSTTSSVRKDGHWASRRSDQSPMANGGAPATGGIEEFKNYLEDQTAVLVHSIQPLVHSIRSHASNTPFPPDEEAAVDQYVDEISRAVKNIAYKTDRAINELENAALGKHAPPVVEALEDCRAGLVETNSQGRKDGIPPLAFKIARATKELVLRVDRIESGELTDEMTLPTDF